MKKWNTLHIFGFGDVQLITDDGSVTKKASELLNLNSVIDMIWATKPTDNPLQKEYHAINIFYSMFSDWQAKNVNEEGFRTPYANLNNNLIQSLVDEMLQVALNKKSL